MSRPPAISRRGALKLGLGAVAAGALPGAGRASSASERKFLFIFAEGGWDPTYVLANLLESEHVDTEPDAVAAEAGVPFVDHPDRPNVRAFFERFGDQCCIIHGFEVRSITHSRCTRLVFTGAAASGTDDWAATLGGLAEGFQLPTLVLSGPSFSSQYTSSVMRVGSSGQLGGLLTGDALSESDLAASPLSAAADARVTQYLRDRVDAWQVGAGAGRATVYAEDLQIGLDQADLLVALGEEVDFAVDTTSSTSWVNVSELALPAIRTLELGYTRCAAILHRGLYNVGWDSHDGIEAQVGHWDLLFEDLTAILADLGGRTSASGGVLADEVTVVVFSEMGRTPKLNNKDGKDHWTYTSALIIGPGVAGGRVVGAYDGTLMGVPIDLGTGEPSDTGTALTAAHFGATLLALGDVDPGEHLGVDPILAALG